ncbi:MAG TPA: hypothetical protein VHP55_11970 [Usitatibacter sp.]|nr:hypothetical protein [Usitatibacter sp.]
MKSASQGVVVSVDGNFIRDIAKRACELQGLPPDGWLERLNPDQRLSFERGVAHTLRAMQSLGWKFVPPGT